MSRVVEGKSVWWRAERAGLGRGDDGDGDDARGSRCGEGGSGLRTVDDIDRGREAEGSGGDGGRV